MKTLAWLISSLLAAPLMAQSPTELSDEEIQAIAQEAYIYGYPLVTIDLTRQVMTNTVTPDGTKAPMGQFMHMRDYPTASFRDVTAPNADTLYSTAWLDLSKEPYILHVPDVNDRYYLMPMLSGWTDVFANPGTRTTGSRAADFAITGPNWKGTLPPNVKELKSPTNMVWILGRTYCTGTPEDYEIVHAIQDQYALYPLSAFGKTYTPPNGLFNPNLNMQTAVRDQVNALDSVTFFNKLSVLMKNNPPAAADGPMLEKMAKMGLVPGEAFDSKMESRLQNIPKKALEKIMAHEKDAGKFANGWAITTHTGNYGTDYLQRALIALIGLGANLPEDAIYPSTKVDSEGKVLNGAHRYVLQFPQGQLPPVKAFWSLTMYDDHYFFVSNRLNRYTLSPRNSLKFNPDGSLDLYIQNAYPGKDKESNWLPAPSGNFILMLRLYWPEEPVIKGTWQPPGVVQTL